MPEASCSYLGRDVDSDDTGENERSERFRTLRNMESHLLVGRITSPGVSGKEMTENKHKQPCEPLAHPRGETYSDGGVLT